MRCAHQNWYPKHPASEAQSPQSRPPLPVGGRAMGEGTGVRFRGGGALLPPLQNEEPRVSETRENRDQRGNGDSTTRNPMRTYRPPGKLLSRNAQRTYPE